jgi:hypothetical protein
VRALCADEESVKSREGSASCLIYIFIFFIPFISWLFFLLCSSSVGLLQAGIVALLENVHPRTAQQPTGQ